MKPNLSCLVAAFLIATLSLGAQPVRDRSAPKGGWIPPTADQLKKQVLINLRSVAQDFYKDLQMSNCSKNVTVLITTDFNRSISENNSLGTDHGRSFPMLVLGENVNPGFIGKFADLMNVDSEGNLIHKNFHVNQVLGSIMEQLFGLYTFELSRIGLSNYNSIDVLKK